MPVDAVIYGPANPSGLIDESGIVDPPDVGDAPASQGIERRDIAGAWAIQSTPNPNNCTVLTTTLELPPLTPPGSVLISAVNYNAYDNGDEGFRLTNVSTQVVTLTNWIATDGNGEGTLNLTGTLQPDQSIWLAKRAITFTQQFGFKPDYEYETDTDPDVPDLTGSAPMLAPGDELAIREGADNWIDAVVWGSSGQITDTGWLTGWIGSNVYAYTGTLATTGQILYRKLDETTGRIVSDTNTALDWANDRTDPVLGRKVMYPGWALERFWQTAKVTDTAALTVAIAPMARPRSVENSTRSSPSTSRSETRRR